VAIHAMQRRQNIRAALEDFIKTYLVTADGLTVHYPRVPFNSAGVASWVRLDYLDKNPTARFARVAADTPGQDVAQLFQVTCFVRYTGATAAGSLEALRDKVVGRLHENVEIAVKDWATSGTTIVDYVIIGGPSGETEPRGGSAPTPQEELEAITLTYELRYIEPHAST